MARDDYTSAGGGLKLKGVAGVKKKKKKSKEKEKGGEATNEKREQALLDAVSEHEAAEREVSIDHEGLPSLEGKTEAERRHEEMRRRRLLERFKKEGIKTHKERVEELNKYLSGLSEHHDMPRIGPG